MAGRREAYEAGRADERSEVVAWLRSLAAEGDPPADDERSCAIAEVADRLERAEHAEVVVAGLG